jgi:rSAM/selenodomain-associated transferase 2
MGTCAGTLDLTVVIPALNAERLLQACVGSLGAVRAIIVVDGGSRDATRAVATGVGARLVQASRGRGTQIAAGVAAADPGWLLVLHADTRLEPGWRRAAVHHMARGPGLAASFRFALDSPDPRARRVERLVAWRCRRLALPYGDQGLLIHGDLLRQIGGVRPLPLMEDVDLVRRIGRGRLVVLEPGAVTSAEKWDRDGWWWRSARNLLCLSLWFLGVPPRLIARVYG